MRCPSRLVVTVKREGKFINKNIAAGAPQYDVKDHWRNGRNRYDSYVSHQIPRFSRKRLIYEFDILQSRIRELAFLNKGIEINLTR